MSTPPGNRMEKKYSPAKDGVAAPTGRKAPTHINTEQAQLFPPTEENQLSKMQNMSLPEIKITPIEDGDVLNIHDDESFGEELRRNVTHSPDSRPADDIPNDTPKNQGKRSGTRAKTTRKSTGTPGTHETREKKKADINDDKKSPKTGTSGVKSAPSEQI